MTDREDILVEKARSGDTSAQKAIYSRHVRYLAAVCSRYIINPEDVRDVLQESFLKIFSSLDLFEFRGEGSLRAWMCRIVLNKTMNFMQRNGRIRFTDLAQAEEPATDDGPELDNIPAEIIHQAIRELPDGYRTVFNLYVVEEKSHREIAQLLNIKESTSASQLHRAKMALASRLKSLYESIQQ